MPIRKNTKRIDPRYFLNEKTEVLKESLVDDIFRIIKNHHLDNIDDTELDYAIRNDDEVKKKFPQLSRDQIYKAMNDEMLDPYYDSEDGVYSKNPVTEEQDDSTDVHIVGGGVRSVKGTKDAIIRNLEDAMGAAQRDDFTTVASKVAFLHKAIKALKDVGEAR